MSFREHQKIGHQPRKENGKLEKAGYAPRPRRRSWKVQIVFVYHHQVLPREASRRSRQRKENTIDLNQGTNILFSNTYLTRTRPSNRGGKGRTNRSSRGGIRSRHAMVTVLCITMRPFRARIHLWRRRVTLVLSHIVTLGLIGRIRRWIGGAGGRNGGIYRNARVRLQIVGGGAVHDVEIGLGVMVTGVSIITGAQGVVQRRTCCLSHTCRAAWLGVRRVVVLRRTGEIVGVRRTRSSSRRRLAQTVV